MRFISLISSLAASLAVLSTTVLAANDTIKPAAPPTFEPLFFGAFDLGEVATTKGPLGNRLFAQILGANITDLSGKPVASVVGQSADTGLITDSGIFFPEVVLTWRWQVDGKLAYLNLNGVGVFLQSDLTHVHLETDSETYSHLNSRFLVANVSFPADYKTGGKPVITLFGVL